MDKLTLFIVEDDPWYANVLSYHLSMNPDYDVHVYESGAECLKHLDLGPDLISIDYGLEDMSGLELLRKIHEWDNELPVIIVSGQNDIAVAVELLKKGAFDYILKDDHTKELLWNAVNRIKERQELRSTVDRLSKELKHKYDFNKTIIGSDSSLSQVYKLMEKAVESNINVSISGETGTGKDLVAKAIHYNSNRRSKPFIAVNMAAIPSELIESELFGYEKGAFTGAMRQKKGKFEEANGGTLFLDEIGDLDLSVQSSLLRVLQERELTRVGGSDIVKLNVRLIVATHKSLTAEVDAGTFREDLYYRVMGLPIHLPPLREREGDVLRLCEYFLEVFSKENETPRKRLSEAAREKLVQYSFPGNVRELRSVIEVAAVLADGEQITPSDIHFKSAGGEMAILQQEKSLRAYTCDIVKHYLEKYNYDVVQVANRLEVGKSTIYKMIQDKEIVIDKV